MAAITRGPRRKKDRETRYAPGRPGCWRGGSGSGKVAWRQHGPHSWPGWRFSYSRAEALVIRCQGCPSLAPTIEARAQRQRVGSTFCRNSANTCVGIAAQKIFGGANADLLQLSFRSPSRYWPGNAATRRASRRRLFSNFIRFSRFDSAGDAVKKTMARTDPGDDQQPLDRDRGPAPPRLCSRDLIFSRTGLKARSNGSPPIRTKTTPQTSQPQANAAAAGGRR